MKWLKHLTNAHRGEFLIRLRSLHGNEIIGVWWTLCEVVGDRMDDGERCFAEYPVKSWCEFVAVTPKKLLKFLKVMEKFSNVTAKFWKDDGHEMLRITIPKLLELRDEWTTRAVVKNKKTRESLGSDSGETPSRSEEKRTEEKREEHNARGDPFSFERSPDVERLQTLWCQLVKPGDDSLSDGGAMLQSMLDRGQVTAEFVERGIRNYQTYKLNDMPVYRRCLKNWLMHDYFRQFCKRDWKPPPQDGPGVGGARGPDGLDEFAGREVELGGPAP